MPPARGSGHPRPSSHGYNPYAPPPAQGQGHHPQQPRTHLSPAEHSPYQLPQGPFGNSSLPAEPSPDTSIQFTFPPSDEETKPIIPLAGHYLPPMTHLPHQHLHNQHQQHDYAQSSMAAEVMEDEQSGSGEVGGSTSRSGVRGSASSKRAQQTQRQQFTACGACRLRRVKCDLKDVAMTRLPDSSEPLSCTNCRQRVLLCIDEYAKKPAKMMRRGRRLQEAQRIYGLGSDSQSSSPTGATFGQNARKASIIPALQPSFFKSEFFRHFYFQRPIVDSSEFNSFCEPTGMGLLGEAGDLVAKCLVIWAASYGVDPAGHVFSDTRDDLKQRMDKCKPMVQEVLDEIDRRGCLRKLSWDHVRLMCLLLPLTLDTLTTHARNAMYRAALSQAYELSRPTVDPVRVDRSMELVTFLKLRILWYVLVFEGVKTALYGNPLLLDEEVWKGCLPVPRPTPFESGPNGVHPPGTTPAPRTRPAGRSNAQPATHNAVTRTSYVPADDLSALWGYALPPVDASFACRRIHAELTCDRAQSRSTVDPKAVQKIWELLERCWAEFEDLKSVGPLNVGDGAGFGGSVNILPEEERAMLASRWQIFLVECHVVVLDALKARLMKLSEAKPDAVITSESSPLTSPVEPSHSEFTNVQQLVAIAKNHCARAAERGIAMLPWLLSTNLFQHDSTLVCRGVFLAARFVLEEHRAQDDEVSLCLQALERMHWSFGDSMELDTKLREMIDVENERRQRLSQPQPMAQPMQTSTNSMGAWSDYSPELAQPSAFTSGYAVPDDYQFSGTIGGNLPGTYGAFTQVPVLASANVHMYTAPPQDGAGGAIYPQEPMTGGDHASYHEQINGGPGQQVNGGSGQPTPDSVGEAHPFAYSVGGVGPGGSSTSPSTVHNSRPTSSHQSFHGYSQLDSFNLHTPTGSAFPPFASPNSIGQGSAMQFVVQELDSAQTFQHPFSPEHPTPSKPNFTEAQLQYPYDPTLYNTSPYLPY
ncbi:hypothetical protein CALCODRAFT_496447 [Calocera cornea HHB12733]|uniref:Zn(2)-C6 fungal-type domain-containing protein n=1 Tax=Calocera cornea HHB12733 TaxID=1353952 RepID=A0A165FSM7_9BASI|nr:hypothetical protein CALCODRAFT_496447 [Calocera cornea HHB12733]